MIKGMLLVMLVLLGNVPSGEKVPVSLSREVFSSDDEPGWGWAQHFRVSEKPVFPDPILPESPGAALRFGRVSLGKINNLPLLLTRLPGKEDFTALYLDLNLNNDFTDDAPPWPGRVERARNRVTAYFPDLTISVPDWALGRELSSYPNLVEKSGVWRGKEDRGMTPRETFEGAFRFSAPDRKNQPMIGAFFARYWMLGKTRLISGRYAIYLLDFDYDGFYSTQDRWALVRIPGGSGSADIPAPASFRPITDPIALPDGTAWRLTKIYTDGSRALLERVVGKSTGTAVQERILPPAPPWPKSETPIPWIDGLGHGLNRAKVENKPVLILITTTNCPYSQSYLDEVLSDANVVELAQAFIPVHLVLPPLEIIDQLDVSGFPYLLILDHRMQVLRRIAGYVTVPQLITQLEKVLHARAWMQDAAK